MFDEERDQDLLNAVIRKFGGKDILRRFLDGQFQISFAEDYAIPTWKSVRLGTGLKKGSDFRAVLRQHNIHVNITDENVLDEFVFTPHKKYDPTIVDLVAVSLSELGFQTGTQHNCMSVLGFGNVAPHQEVESRAIEMGLEVCPPEVGPQLRLQYPDQPAGECRR